MSLGAFSGARTETKERKTDESTGAQVKIKLLDQWLYRGTGYRSGNGKKQQWVCTNLTRA
jgi:hypothetical protein